MPRVAFFYGIAIYVYFDDHAPPHFHARYAGARAQIRIDDLKVVRGKLPPRALRLTLEWAKLHQAELRDAWVRASHDEDPGQIEPLR